MINSRIDDEPKNEILVREPAILERIDNRIYFYSEIDRVGIMTLNKELRNISSDMIIQSKTQESELPNIFLHINSYGGNIFAGLAALDEILKCNVPVYTIVDGCCASAATFLSVVGHKRYINKHAFMLIHQLSSAMWGKYEEFKDEQKNLDKLMDTIKGIYNEYTKIPPEEIEGILKRDLWFDADTCLEYGLVDEII
jgi:ATP-dependent Clp endopeptidase proteolytic subunit ClpP